VNDLEKYFFNNKGHLIDKWRHYFDIYDRYFSRFRGQSVHVMEIGVDQGGSLQMWKNYFGPKARIYGVDINPDCKRLEEEQISIFIGSQESKPFLRSLKSAIPKLDILIDDGGHTIKQQITTFEELYEYIHAYGVYLCEDLHSSYRRKRGGISEERYVY
jgi:23S rRNA U2552 (ribose-2'-O)-methylase RlmE/FtsJ